jgi:hypothetical protein
MAEQGKMNVVLAVIAVAILVGSGATYAYTSIPKAPVETITVDGTEYTWDALFSDFAVVSFQANAESFEGIRLSELVNDTGLADPTAHQYRITSGEDGYSKTVSWENVLNGYLVLENKRVVFSDMKTSFWVRQVAEIGVV